ncbi:MAG: hypothetical protein ABWZ76_02965 [Acidimicrobiales bacterium]
MLTDAGRPRRLLYAADLRAALPGWVAGRLLTAGAWLLAVVLVDRWHHDERSAPLHLGLFAWDGSYYRAIADHGYGGSTPDTARFHPLFPWLGGNDLGLVVLANVAALVAAALVHRLVVEVLADRDLARRSATLVGIAPPAFVLVWAYAEGLFLALSAVLFLALHRRWWWVVAVAGVMATLTRPTGLLLAVPVLIAVVAAGRAEGRYVARAVAVVAPVATMLGWLWWVRERVGDDEGPLRVQGDLRDGTHFPLFRLIEGFGEVLTDPLGDGLHVPFALGIVLLAWVAWRRLPLTWSSYALAAALLFLTAGNLNSIERYALGTLPLIVAAASLVGGRWWRPAVAVSGAMLVGMTALAWYGSYVP